MKLPVDLQPGETVVLRCRRHPVYLITKLIGSAAAGILPAAVLLWAGNALLGLGGLGGAALWGIALLWLVFWAVRAYFIWYRHEHDEWLVTNQRLIDSYKRHWFDQRLASADLVNVQDISVHKRGLLATIFNLGDVRCQTAGAESEFVLSGIPQPAQVLALIDATRDAARLDIQGGRGRVRGADATSARLPDAIPPDISSHRSLPNS